MRRAACGHVGAQRELPAWRGALQHGRGPAHLQARARLALRCSQYFVERRKLSFPRSECDAATGGRHVAALLALPASWVKERSGGTAARGSGLSERRRPACPMWAGADVGATHAWHASARRICCRHCRFRWHRHGVICCQLAGRQHGRQLTVSGGAAGCRTAAVPGVAGAAQLLAAAMPPLFVVAVAF